jgi:hypothetical protein
MLAAHASRPHGRPFRAHAAPWLTATRNGELKMKKMLLFSASIVALGGCATMESGMNSMMGVAMKGDLIPCPTKTPIGEVPSCGKVWKLTSGSAKLKTDGTLTAEVKGLVLNDPSTGKFNGTPDGVDGVAGAVICGGKVAAQSAVVALSKVGDASVNEKLKIPSDCASPVIALRERYEGKVGGWLAATGTGR